MINTIHVGIGPIGQKIVKYTVERGCFNIAGAVDPDPDMAGKEPGELCDINPLGITVSSNLNEAIRCGQPEVAIVTTLSSVAAFESRSWGQGPALRRWVISRRLLFSWKQRYESFE